MPYFTDSQGRDWCVRVTPLAMRDVRDFCGVNLGTVLRDEMKALVELLDSPPDLCSVLYAICRQQCIDRNVSLDEFLDSIVGESLGRAAEALVEGLQQVFPPRQALQLMVVTKLLKQSEIDTQKKVDELSKALTGASGDSRWQAFLAWTRGLTQGRTCGQSTKSDTKRSVKKRHTRLKFSSE